MRRRKALLLILALLGLLALLALLDLRFVGALPWLWLLGLLSFCLLWPTRTLSNQYARRRRRQKGLTSIKRKRKHKAPPPKYPQYPPPTGMIGTKPPRERVSRLFRWGGSGLTVHGNGQTMMPKPSIKRAMLWTALFVFFLIAVTVLELALRG